MHVGQAPSFEALVGWEFDGVNTARLAAPVRKFRKGFYDGPPRERRGPEPCIHGFNIPIHQDGVMQPHRAKPSDDEPRRFGFYRVHSVDPAARDARYPAALLLDYGLGRNPVLDPSSRLRDYLVQIYPDDSDLLLGHAFVALTRCRISMGFFVLTRARRHRFGG